MRQRPGATSANSHRLIRVGPGTYTAVLGGEVYRVERHGLDWQISTQSEIAMVCRSLRQVRRVLASIDRTLAAVGDEVLTVTLPEPRAPQRSRAARPG